MKKCVRKKCFAKICVSFITLSWLWKINKKRKRKNNPGTTILSLRWSGSLLLAMMTHKSQSWWVVEIEKRKKVQKKKKEKKRYTSSSIFFSISNINSERKDHRSSCRFRFSRLWGLKRRKRWPSPSRRVSWPSIPKPLLKLKPLRR